MAAWIFLKYFTTPERQVEWAQASGYFPVRSKAAEGLATIAHGDKVKTTLDHLNQEANTILIEQMKPVRPTPVLSPPT